MANSFEIFCECRSLLYSIFSIFRWMLECRLPCPSEASGVLATIRSTTKQSSAQLADFGRSSPCDDTFHYKMDTWTHRHMVHHHFHLQHHHLIIVIIFREIPTTVIWTTPVRDSCGLQVACHTKSTVKQHSTSTAIQNLKYIYYLTTKQ